MPDNSTKEMARDCFVDTLQPFLINLFHESERIINDKNYTGEQSCDIATWFENTRALLTELRHYGTRLGMDNKHIVMITDLIERCLSLEGSIKEIRNDMCRNS